MKASASHADLRIIMAAYVNGAAAVRRNRHIATSFSTHLDVEKAAANRKCSAQANAQKGSLAVSTNNWCAKWMAFKSSTSFVPAKMITAIQMISLVKMRSLISQQILRIQIKALPTQETTNQLRAMTTTQTPILIPVAARKTATILAAVAMTTRLAKASFRRSSSLTESSPIS